jgi:hypothetical protein
MSREDPTPLDSLWFDDGSVILIAVARHPQSGVEPTQRFCVHRSVLAAHSDVIGGMFLFPQPQEVEKVESRPVVHMPDAAEDLAHLLKALYDPGWVSSSDYANHIVIWLLRYFPGSQGHFDLPTQWDLLAGVLRLSTKYSISVLRHRAVAILTQYWPITLATYKAATPATIKTSEEYAVRAIKLARECDVRSIIPVAFYFLAWRPLSQIFAERDLDYDDIASCVMGRDRLRIAARTQVYTPLFLPGIGWNEKDCECDDPQGACAAFISSKQVTPEDDAKSGGPGCLDNHIRWPRKTKSNKMYEDPPCSACLRSMQKIEDEGRQKVWNMLPEYFMLGPWGELLHIGSEV